MKADELFGRTIEGALVCSWKVVLNLGNGDYFCIAAAHDYDDDVKLEFDEVPSPNELHSAGILSEEEYAAAIEEQARLRADRIKTRELSQLAQLRQKYPEWSK